MNENKKNSCEDCYYNNGGWCEVENKPIEDEGPGFVFPESRFAATCGDCYWNEGGWCRKGGGWRDADRWSCSDYAPG